MELYFHSPSKPSRGRARLKHRDNFTFTFTFTFIINASEPSDAVLE
jgi:hypothetical protein